MKAKQTDKDKDIFTSHTRRMGAQYTSRSSMSSTRSSIVGAAGGLSSARPGALVLGGGCCWCTDAGCGAHIAQAIGAD